MTDQPSRHASAFAGADHGKPMRTRPGTLSGLAEEHQHIGRGAPVTRGELATLWVDDPGAAFNISLICRFTAGPFARPDGGVDVETIRDELCRRTAGVPALRRRLSGGGQPTWVEEAFEPHGHVLCTALPAGSDLQDWCADRIVEPLNRERPLWRADVISLPDEEFVVLFVVHHVLADGRRGIAILQGLLDAAGSEAHDSRPKDRHHSPASSSPRSHRWQRIRDAVADLHGRAPVTSLSEPVGRGRRLAVVCPGLDGLEATGAALGATVNDLLLAAVTAGLRTLLADRGDPVDELTLRASVPVSSGTAEQPEGMLLVSLPVAEADPLRRLAMITSTTTYLKRRLRSGGGNVFDVLRLPTPLARAAVRWMRHIAARGINLFITNVPGPTEPLFLAGARLLSAVPVAPLTANVPLGIAALSYAGTLQIGVNADASVTDLAVLRDAMATEFATLATSARSGAGLPRIETGAHQASVGAAPKSGGAGMAGKKWADLSHRQRVAVLVLGSAQLLLAGSAWSDLAHRPAGQVNGRKGVWAAVIAVNWLGPLAYFRWGRRG